jgi:superfamily II DNA or RNA helicase
MYTLGFCLGLFEDKVEYYMWARKHGVVKGQWGFTFNRNNPEHMLKVHHAIFPKFGYRKKVKDIPGFPESQIQTLLVEGEETKEVKRYLEILATMKQFDEPLPITEELRARQLSEMLKVKEMIDTADDLLEENLSVCFFVCFKESFKTIEDHYAKKAIDCSLVYGGQTDREDHIHKFQNNENHVIICQIQAGGESINLHDLHGRQRVSLISPSYNAIEFVQVLGRIHRAGAKSPAIQKIFFCKDTVEEKVKRAVDAKVNNISLLNDGDMTPYEK